jgi:thiol-disulfide isomerase/thioredoxin
MLERFLILVILLAGIFFLYRRFLITKTNGSLNILNQPWQLAGINPELPTIVYFWTEQCAQCFSLQNPALSKLKQNNSNFNLISYNALNEEEVVKTFSIKTVPSTAIISPENEVKFINNGFAGEDLLAAQLKKASN